MCSSAELVLELVRVVMVLFGCVSSNASSDAVVAVVVVDVDGVTV